MQTTTGWRNNPGPLLRLCLPDGLTEINWHRRIRRHWIESAGCGLGAGSDVLGGADAINAAGNSPPQQE